MSADGAARTDTGSERRRSWLPMLVIALAQILLAFNINALRVSIGGIVSSFHTAPSTVGTAIVVHLLLIAGLVMLGARIATRFGPRRVFQATVVGFGIAMALMAVSPNADVMILAQGIAGVAAAAMVPALVVLIAAAYQGRQRAEALGWLGAAEALGGVVAFLIAGSLGVSIGWQYSFVLLALFSAAVVVLSRTLPRVPPEPEIRIDGLGAVLALVAIVLISIGFDRIESWGLGLARPPAPFSVLGVSPALVMIIAGVLIGQLFLGWTRLRRVAKREPLVALEVVRTRAQRAAMLSMFIVVVLGAAASFLIPLYIEIVQGLDSLRTALAIIPQSVAIFAAAILVTRLYDRLALSDIARLAFALVAAGLLLLAVVVRNEWETFMVAIALVIAGLGQGALVTVLFNALAALSPSALAGDVASLRGTANNLAGAVGTALAGALLIGVLSAGVTTSLAGNPVITQALTHQVDLDTISFVSNERLRQRLERTTATPVQVAEAVRINTRARLRALRVSLLALAALALLAIFPAGRLPRTLPRDRPAAESV